MKYLVECEFNEGYQCVVTFDNNGYRCGYVGIPKTHPLYGKYYDDVDCLHCHGGVTYSGGGEKSQYPVESDLWWFGFDCGHEEDHNVPKEFVANECKKLAEQLLERRI